MLEPNFFEAQKSHELEKPTPIQVGVRIFNVGLWSEKAENNMRNALAKVSAIAKEAGKIGVGIVVISNDDIAPEGRLMLEQITEEIGVQVLYSPSEKARRRAQLARALVAGANPAGTFSYADMLETLSKSERATKLVGFISSDLLTPESIECIDAARRVYEHLADPNCYIVGVAVQGVHDIIAVQEVIEGKRPADLQVLWRIFPNNAFSITVKGVGFSGMMDNGNTGIVILPDGEKVAVGGNEEFVEFSRRSIVAWNPQKSQQPPYVILLTRPNMVRDLKAEWPAHEGKYARRSIIYTETLKRDLNLAWRRGAGVFAKGGDLYDLKYEEVFDKSSGKPHPHIVSELMARRLFFATAVEGEQPRIMPTKRQTELYGW